MNLQPTPACIVSVHVYLGMMGTACVEGAED